MIRDFYTEKRHHQSSQKPKKLPVAVTEEEFSLLIHKTKEMKQKLAFLLAFSSGLRISEIVTLKKENIDIKERKILIEEGKGKKDRIVPLPKGFKEVHLKYFPMKYANKKSGVRTLQNAFKRVCISSGLTKTKPTIHFHSLRHGFGSQCAKKGIPIHHIRTLMGHSNISTTNVYLELNPQEALKSYEDKF
ncbi:MAG TPA: tyrosine-type recombinase/integrase [Candidatus Lokiarchaeia archaeon]